MVSWAAAATLVVMAAAAATLTTAAAASPMKMYEKAETDKYRTVLVPVSSTVIPLDDLPQYRVGAKLGVAPVPTATRLKPDGPVKLITIHSLKKKNGKKDSNPAQVEEVTQEEYKKLTEKLGN